MDLGPCWEFFLPNGSTGVSKIIQKWKFSFGVQMHARSTSSVTKHNSVRCMLDILESSSFECSIWGLSSLPTSATSLIATAAAYVIGGKWGGGCKHNPKLPVRRCDDDWLYLLFQSQRRRQSVTHHSSTGPLLPGPIPPSGSHVFLLTLWVAIQFCVYILNKFLSCSLQAL